MFNIAEIYLKSIAVISQLSLQSIISLFQIEKRQTDQYKAELTRWLVCQNEVRKNCEIMIQTTQIKIIEYLSESHIPDKI